MTLRPLSWKQLFWKADDNIIGMIMPPYMDLVVKQWDIVASSWLFDTSDSTLAARLGDALQFPPEGTDVKTLWKAKMELERGQGGIHRHHSIGTVASGYASLLKGESKKVAPCLNSLERIIMRRIRASGEISFREFMRLALYGQKGFYTQRVEIGAKERVVMSMFDKIKRNLPFGGLWAPRSDWFAYPKKDFITSSEYPAFAEQMGRLVLRLVPSLRPGPIYFVEQGGGSGKFAKGLLEFLQREAPDIYKRFYYLLYEISPNLAAMQREALREHPRVRILRASAVGAKIPTKNVLVFSNELPDAFPVDVAFFKGDQAYSLKVGTDGRYFLPIASPLTDEASLEYLKRHGYWELAPRVRRENRLSAVLAMGVPINLDMEDCISA